MLPVVTYVQLWFTITDKKKKKKSALKVRVPVVEPGPNVSLIVVSQISFNQGWKEYLNTLHMWRTDDSTVPR